MSSRIGTKAVIAILVTLIAVISFSLGTVAITPTATAVNNGTTAQDNTSIYPSINNQHLSQVVQGSGLSTSQNNVVGNITIIPETTSYNSSAPISVSITLKPTQDLQNFANQIDNPSSTLYRHYITATQIGQQFGVGSGTYASIIQYFSGYGLSATPSATLLTLQVSGTVAEMQQAFHTQFEPFAELYQSPGVWNPSFGNSSAIAGSIETGPVFYANTISAQLPTSISQLVSGIAGLSNVYMTPDISMPIGLHPYTNNSGLGYINSSSTCSFGITGACPQSLNINQNISTPQFLWTNFTKNGQTCSTADICGDYQFLFPSSMGNLLGANNLWSGQNTISSEPDTGQGITIAVVEVGCGLPSDFAQWSAMTFGSTSQLTNRLTQIAVSTTYGSPNQNLQQCITSGMNAGWTTETELDVEYAAAMAPGAHIDVIGIPYPGYLADFDTAYTDIAQYLSLGSTGGVCPTTSTLNAVGLYIVEGSAAGACSITIDSNSYGSGEVTVYFQDSPMYITAEDENLQILNSVGVTNFFSSGDGGAWSFGGGGVQASIPADSIGATSVGGAMVTATGDGSEFPITSNSFTYCDGTISGSTCNGVTGTAYWSPISGVESTTYWSYPLANLYGTLDGFTGGGYGQSITHSQPWWQNALDTYSTASAIEPQISGSAAFNMSVYALGGWTLFIGGTSFASPTTAGEWALIEEQANVLSGNPEMGNINPILYDAHNAFQSVNTFGPDPFLPFENMGVGFDWAPYNAMNWWYFNISYQEPSNPIEPIWFPSIFNPAGSGWNYLQGLGVMQPTILDNELFGQTGLSGHSLANPLFSVMEVTSTGLVPFNTLVAGQTYTFEIVASNGVSGGVFNIQMYSGQSNNGMYGGGTVTSIQTGSNGQFTYTPTSGVSPGGDAATTYGYVEASVPGGSEWTFDSFAVSEPTPAGAITLCVHDVYGNCSTTTAETTEITTTYANFVREYIGSQVYLNGVPVAGAVVSQVAVQVNYNIFDPTLPSSYYAPGMTIGQTITDGRGEAVSFSDSFIEGVPGINLPQIFKLTATYDGLVSNTVTVIVEPRSGSMYTNDISMNTSGTSITGVLSFSELKYVSFINVSIGNSPGQYLNYSCGLPSSFLGSAPTFYGFGQAPNTVPFPNNECQPFFDSGAPFTYQYPAGVFNSGLWESSISSGSVPISLSTAGLSGPIVVNILAGGAGDFTFTENFCGQYGCFSYVAPDIMYPIYWQDPVVFLPATLSSVQTATTVSGNDTFTFSGTGTSGSLELVSGQGTTVLATGVSGTYTLNTATLSDGWYSVLFVTTGYGATTTKTVTFYADNTAESLSGTIATLQAEVSSQAATITSLNGQLSSDASQISSLQASLASANANINTLQGEVSSLTSQVSSLKSTVSTLSSQLSAAQASIGTLQSQVASLNSTNAADGSLIAQLQADLTTAQSTISTQQSQLAADQNTITSDTQTIQQLQNELNAKKTVSTPPPATTSGIPPMTVLVLGIIIAVAGIAIGLMLRRKTPSRHVDGTPSLAKPVVKPVADEDKRTLLHALQLSDALKISGNSAEAAAVQARVDNIINQIGLSREDLNSQMYR